MAIEKYWRNKQLGHSSTLLQQEQFCWDFLERNLDVNWAWYGQAERFEQLCHNTFKITNDQDITGIIVINHRCVSPKSLVDFVNSKINEHTKAAYLAINRFNLFPINDLNINYHHEIRDSIDQIVSHINMPLTRADVVPERDIDGHHFVGVHGLDIFTYECSH